MLSEKHLAYCEEYLQCWNQTEAYCRVYPDSSREAAMRSASQLMRNPDVKAYIAERLKEKAMAADEVLARLTSIARADIGAFMQVNDDGFAYFDFSGPEAVNGTHLIKKVKTKRSRRVDGKGDDAEVWEDEAIELELHDAHKALEDLAKYHNLFTEKDEDGNPLTDEQRIARVMAILDAARARRDGQVTTQANDTVPPGPEAASSST
jgi:phage terminase small subunit